MPTANESWELLNKRLSKNAEMERESAAQAGKTGVSLDRAYQMLKDRAKPIGNQDVSVNNSNGIMNTLGNAFDTVKSSLSSSSDAALSELQSGINPVEGREGFTFDKEKAMSDVGTMLDVAPFAARVGAGIATSPMAITVGGLIGSAAAVEGAGLATEALTSGIKEYIGLSPDEDETIIDFINQVEQGGLQDPEAQAMIKKKVEDAGTNMGMDILFGAGFGVAASVASYTAKKVRLMYDVKKAQKAASQQELYQRVDQFVDKQIQQEALAEASNRLGVPLNLATAGKADEVEFLTKIPYTAKTIKTDSEKAVKILDDLTTLEIESIGKAKSPTEITNKLNEFIKTTEKTQFDKAIPKGVAEGIEVGRRLQSAATGKLASAQDEISALYKSVKDSLPNDVGIVPENTRKVLEEHLYANKKIREAKLKAKQTEIQTQTLRESIEGGGVRTTTQADTLKGGLPSSTRTKESLRSPVNNGSGTFTRSSTQTTPAEGIPSVSPSSLGETEEIALSNTLDLFSSVGNPMDQVFWDSLRKGIADVAYAPGAGSSAKGKLKELNKAMELDEQLYFKRLAESNKLNPEVQKKLIKARQMAKEKAAMREELSSIIYSRDGQDVMSAVGKMDKYKLKSFKDKINSYDQTAFKQYRENFLHGLAENPKNPGIPDGEVWLNNIRKTKHTGYYDVLFEDAPELKKLHDEMYNIMNQLNDVKGLKDPARASALKKLKTLETGNFEQFTSFLKKEKPDLHNDVIASMLKDLGTDQSGKFSGIVFQQNFRELDHDGIAKEVLSDDTVNKLREISFLIEGNKVNYDVAMNRIKDSWGKMMNYARIFGGGGSLIGGAIVGGSMASGLGTAAGMMVVGETVMRLGPKAWAKLQTNPNFMRWAVSSLKPVVAGKKLTEYQQGQMFGRLLGIAANDKDLRYILSESYRQQADAEQYYLESYKRAKEQANRPQTISQPLQ